MIKDIDYYRGIDLQKAAKDIAALGSAARGSHELFGDTIQALLIAASERTVTIDDLQQVLGAPDRISENDRGPVLHYDWTGKHGPDTYASSTPFQIADRICTGLAD